MNKLLKYFSLFQFMYMDEAGFFPYTSTKVIFYNGLNTRADESPAIFV